MAVLTRRHSADADGCICGGSVMWMQQCWLALHSRDLICNLWRSLHLITLSIGLLRMNWVALLLIDVVYQVSRWKGVPTLGVLIFVHLVYLHFGFLIFTPSLRWYLFCTTWSFKDVDVEDEYDENSGDGNEDGDL